MKFADNAYDFDECKPEMFPLLEQTAQTLRREFPGVLLMTTSYDDSYGLDTVVQAMEAWCPLTPKFKPDQAAKARGAGRQVWWYICCGPHHPHANMFIEYPAIEGRLLMGAMTVKQRPDGFLYYQVSIWNSHKPITSGPFTDWDPRSWTTYHGDGSWTCVGHLIDTSGMADVNPWGPKFGARGLAAVRSPNRPSAPPPPPEAAGGP